MEPKSFNFRVINTLRVEYSSNNKPGNEEIIIFLKELDVNLKSLYGFYGSETEKMFLIKFNDAKDLSICNNGINDKKFMLINQEKCVVKSSILDTFEIDIYLHNLPFEVPDEDVLNKLSNYGKVKRIVWQKSKISEDLSVYNGIRICTIEINKVIPPYIYIRSVKIRAYYQYQKDMCYKCMCLTHHRSCCTEINSHNHNINRDIQVEEQESKEHDKNMSELSDVSKSGIQDNDSDFQLITKKIRKKRAEGANKTIENSKTPFIPNHLKPKKHDHITLNYSTLETEISYILSSTKYSFLGNSYPTTDPIQARYFSKNLLLKARKKMSEWANTQIKNVQDEAQLLGIQLTWFLYGTKVCYFVKDDE